MTLVETDMLGAWDYQCITLQDISIINETLHTKFMNDTQQHFLLQCPLYDNERRLLLETVDTMIPMFHLLPENEKFSAVMQSKTPEVNSGWEQRVELLLRN